MVGQQYRRAGRQRRGGAVGAEQHLVALARIDHADDQRPRAGGGFGRRQHRLRAGAAKGFDFLGDEVAGANRPPRVEKAAGHAAAHVADADDPDGAGAASHVCTSRLALAIDIRMPSPNPSVTIAVPP